MRLIDADELLSIVRLMTIVDKSAMHRLLVQMPTVDAVPVRHGIWWHYEGMLTCSECGTQFYDNITEYCGDHVPKFCPDCGARMDGKDGGGNG